MKKTILMSALVLSCWAFAAGQSKTADNNSSNAKNTTKLSLADMLIGKEKQKWESLSNGRWLELKQMFAEDFVSIGYQPDGSVTMTNKAESFAASGALPAEIKFVLSDFKIILADRKNIVVTYQAAGPIKVQATSHWTKRGKKWQTIFYQATLIR